MAAAVLLLLAVLVAGCGSDGRGVSDAAAADLDARVEQVRQAAVQGDRSAAEGFLLTLRHEVVKFADDGELTDSAARRILEAAAEVETQLAAIPTTTTTVTTTTAPPATRSSGGDRGGGEDKGKHGGHGRDRGDGD